jgi:hypothetical protein
MMVVEHGHVGTYAKQNNALQYLNWMQCSPAPKPRFNQVVGAPFAYRAIPPV